MTSFPIDVPLREARTYLHSTNLFDYLIRKTGASRNLSLSFRGQIVNEVEAYPAAGASKADLDSAPARFSGESDGDFVDLIMVEKTPPVPLVRRQPYNENAVTGGSAIEGAAIVSDKSNGGSPIERIVALNKVLLGHISEKKKTLLFAKIFLRLIPAPEARLKIALKSRLGLTLFRSTIFADGSEIGEVTFYGT